MTERKPVYHARGKHHVEGVPVHICGRDKWKALPVVFTEKITAPQVLAIGLRDKGYDPLMEYMFHDEREWRFDICFPALKLAIEINGAVWRNGRHNRGKGSIEDNAKRNRATLMGWNVLVYDTASALEGFALLEILDYLREVKE